jgi:hypothetical protein
MEFLAETANATGKAARFGREIKTLSAARRQFVRKPSPRIIAIGILTLLASRASLGQPGWRDAVAIVAMLAIYPFGEWAIHVYLLHMRPFTVAGRRIEAPAARAHREHHEQPNDLSLILLEPLELAGLLLLAVPLTVTAGGLLVGLIAGAVPLGPLLSAALTGYAAVGVYEWTHFLIHTAYRPRSRYYRSVWRNHRLHHFKNERFWHGITNDLSDRVLGTAPNQSTVKRSRTARTLDPGPAG